MLGNKWHYFPNLAFLTSHMKTGFSISPQYDLSGKYQINENVAVTTRLVLPLDICNVVLYLTYVVLIIVLRNLKPQISDHRFAALVELVVVVSLTVSTRCAISCRAYEITKFSLH